MSDRVRKIFGLTLLETIIASFLLLMGTLVSFQIFDAAIRYQSGSENKNGAVIAASNKFEEIGAWNASTHFPAGTLPFMDWTVYDGKVYTDPSNPSLKLTLSCTPVARFCSPCSPFESVFTTLGPLNLGAGVSVANDSVQLDNCMEQVTIQANWNGGAANWTRLYASPSGNPALTPVVVVTDSAGAPVASTTLHHDQVIGLRAKLQDTLGNQIDGVTFTWHVNGPGNGMLRSTRDGRYATFTHLVLLKLSNKVYLDDQICTIQARASFMGRAYVGVTGPLSLTL